MNIYINAKILHKMNLLWTQIPISLESFEDTFYMGNFLMYESLLPKLETRHLFPGLLCNLSYDI